MGQTGSFFSELRRRNVFRVAVAYAIVGWLLVEVASVVLPTLLLPDWTLRILVFFVILGFPLALFFAWAYELTPEGLKKEKDVDRSQSITRQTGRKLDFAIIGVLAIAVVLFAVDKFVWVGEGPATGVAVSDDRKSIAVLPFENMSREEANESFTIGIHDDVLTHISRISALKVISRTSVERLDRTMSVHEIGETLGVATILEGGVQRAGDRVRINVQLIDSDTDEHLWAETYDRQLSANDIFAIQSEIAEAISSALKATLSPEEQTQITTAPTSDIDALYAYQLGKQRMETRISTSLEEAAAYFQQAINRDPNYALAYVGLADANLRLTEYGDLSLVDGLRVAERAVKTALSLNSELGEAYASNATVHWKRGELDAAERDFQKAVEFSPNYAPAWQWFGTMLGWRMARADEGVQMLERAVQLDPLSPIIHDNYAMTLSAGGRIEEAIERLQKAIEVDPNFAAGYRNIGGLYSVGLGRLDEAVSWIVKATELDPTNPNARASLGRRYFDLGDESAATKHIEHGILLGPNAPRALFTAAVVNLHGGRNAEAEKLAEQSVAAAPLWSSGPLRILRDFALDSRNYRSALTRYEDVFPDLFQPSPVIGLTNYHAAIDVSLVLKILGREEDAERLLDQSLAHIEKMPRMGIYGYGLADVEILALQARDEEALVALRSGIDEGWRSNWRWLTVDNRNLDSIKDTPEFRVIIADIEADMAAQLERVRAMEASGELEPQLVN